jgi:hypothetical protein
MDPDACLKRLFGALRSRDREAVCKALMDLLDWVSNGGSLPHDPSLPENLKAAEATAEHLRVAAQDLIETAERYERAVRGHTGASSDG